MSNSNIQITHMDTDGLCRTRWSFYVGQAGSITKIYLDYYARERRESRRHKTWEATKSLMTGKVQRYSRLDHRGDGLTSEEVELPADIIREVKEKLMAGVTVEKWKAR